MISRTIIRLDAVWVAKIDAKYVRALNQRDEKRQAEERLALLLEGLQSDDRRAAALLESKFQIHRKSTVRIAGMHLRQTAQQISQIRGGVRTLLESP